jgi:hypothetical protein
VTTALTWDYFHDIRFVLDRIEDLAAGPHPRRPNRAITAPPAQTSDFVDGFRSGTVR